MPNFIYTGILVSNIERFIGFYTRELGMKLSFKTKIKEAGGKVAWLKSYCSKQILESRYIKKYKLGGRSGLEHFCFEVSDMREFSDKLAKVYKRPIERFIEGNQVLSCLKDPDGNWG